MYRFPEFVSVYDHIEGFGRTKSVSFRMWRGARKGVVPNTPEVIGEGISPKRDKRRHKAAVAKLRTMRT